MPKETKNIAASVRARLMNHAQAKGVPFDLVLNRYVIERLLYRLSVSSHANDFVLKGATLLMTWLDEPHRGTRDLDLLGFGDNAPDKLLALFRDVLDTAVPDDGVIFDTVALRVDRIREELAYGGVRLRTTASIAGARISVSVDIGFGDALEPGAEMATYPTLLDLPAPILKVYARETVIAEKFQAMVVLGRANSRMKDFYDIWILSRTFAFADDRLARAIAATFARRRTPIPDEASDALSSAFAADADKQTQWRAFIADVAVDPGSLADVIAALGAFLTPHVAAARRVNGGS
jgi:predicted nucleotidyltransferase component of viral defense system